MRHGTTTIITAIRPGALAGLEARLAEAAEPRAGLFTGVPGLHFARWAIIDLTPPEQTGGPRDPRLILGADFTVPDATASAVQLDRRFLQGLISWLRGLRAQGIRAASLFDDIYRACRGYPEEGLEDPDAVEAYLLSHRAETTARHVDFAYRFAAPEELREAVNVLRAVDRHLDARARLLSETPWRGGRGELPHLHRELRDVALAESATVFDPDWTRRLEAARREAAVATVGYFFYRAFWSWPRVMALKLWLRLSGPKHSLEAGGPLAPELAAARSPSPPRDTLVQNPMVHVARITGGPAAVRLAKAALPSVNLRLRRYLVGLNHIQTIHCARWLLHSDGDDGPHHIIFFSNYDDSWEAYIDAFVDYPDVRAFLELIWSQTDGFPPRVRSLAQAKKRWRRPGTQLPVEPFKAWLRAHEVPTRVWYSAALDGGPPQRHSVLLLHNALRLRELLARERIDRPLRDWAARRAFAAFLSRGACAPGRALPRLPALITHSLSALSAAVRGWLEAARRKHHVPDRAGTPPELAPGTLPPPGALASAGAGRHPGFVAARL
ncbi:hypothetical protein HPC49_18750 [Pyxidicoccus fallax]|uniref:Uncharacterized protein n=1 Tax=Pyxidicoccus fallax TaxID=394095 RepID=A0A848LNX1_9BACT|nr:hypothetical protein [Pyxidicoccus fallax]NMO19548.1 hypothetical protein [Pyxidicoccus fallax]NPC80251.1 hypothetical protein [Pyxidicoccus fallax]